MTQDATLSFRDWICFLTHQGQGFTWDTHSGILPVIFMLATNVTRDLMFCTLRAMIVLVCRQNSTPYKRASTRVKPPEKTSPVIVSNSIAWDLVLIGRERCVLQIPIIIDGPNGFSYNCLTAGMMLSRIKPDPLMI